MRMRFLRHLLAALCAVLVVAACRSAQNAPANLAAVAPAAADSAAPSSYHEIPNGLHLPPGQALGLISGIDFDSKGNAYVFRRCADCGQHPGPNDPPGVVWKFDKAGNYLGQWGEGVVAKEAHSLRIDRNGFVWITDTGAHQVKKYRLDGTLVMTLGKYGVPGDGPDTFNMPTDVLVTKSGDFFVTDGYGNQRVVKFSKDGKFIKSFGSKGAGPGQFRLPHSIAQDSLGRLIVVDRCGLRATGCLDDRIEIFDTDGKYLDQWTHMGGVYLYMTRGDRLYIGSYLKIYVADAKTGKILETLDKTGLNHGLAMNRQGDIFSAGLRDGLKRYTRLTTPNGMVIPNKGVSSTGFSL